MTSLLDLEIQSKTDFGRPLNQNQSPDHTVIDVASVANDALHQRESRKMRRIALLLGSFTLEGLSIALDQLSTPKKPIYAFMSMITASLGLLVSVIELSYRVGENDMIISRLLGQALENFGFFISTWQCIYAVVQYLYLYKKKIDNPIKISLLPLIYVICVAISTLYDNYCGDSSTRRHSYITRESSVDASRTTTLSRVESSDSQRNARAIEEIEPVVEDDPGVLITTKELRNDTTVHQRISSSKNGVKENETEQKIAFRTKSEVDVIDDGYKWRKYAKKYVKNSPHPRYYYKCSTGGCYVKKAVERDREDSSYVITKYQGVHNHDSPHVVLPQDSP